MKAVLFDMDGLLVDTETLCMRVAQKVAEEFGYALSGEEVRGLVGVTVKKFYNEFFESRGLRHDLTAILKRQHELYEQSLATNLRTFDGARTLPKALKTKGYKLGLVSGSIRKEVLIILNALDIHNEFEAIVTADDIATSKPDPEGYLFAAKQLGVEPSECVVLEDARTGVLAGKAAGMRVVGVENNGGQDLSAADVVVENLAAIEADLDILNA